MIWPGLRSACLSLLCGAVTLIVAHGGPADDEAPAPRLPEIVPNAPVDHLQPPSNLARVELLQAILDLTSPGPQGQRILLCEIRCTNISDQELTLAVDRIRLRIEGRKVSPELRPTSLQSVTVQARHERLRVQDLPQHQELRIPPQDSATTWVIFSELPVSGEVPAITLEVPLDGLHLIEIYEIQQQRLQLSVERIGPQGILGLLTIKGELNTVNVGALVAEIDRLAAQGVTHVVVSFPQGAARPPDVVSDWMEQMATDRERSRLQARFPALPVTVVELHLAAIPGRETRIVDVPLGRPRIHVSANAAVEWALQPILDRLSADQILQQIEQGHPLVRAAALATGGLQLTAEHVPLLLELSRSKDAGIQRGAILALGQSDEPSAIVSLVKLAQGESASLATLAVECLAASRYGAAHDALDDVLTSLPAVPLLSLTHILSRYPRERWIKPLERLASGEWRREGTPLTEQANVRSEALLALDRIGHPHLVQLLAGALVAEDAQIRDTAFSLLIKRTDAYSEEVALNYALEILPVSFPSPQMLGFLQRVRDPRTVMPLIEHLRESEADRSELIKTLAQIGNESIDQVLFDHFDGLQPREQQVALAQLAELGSPHAYTLAVRGVQSEQSSTFNASVGVLQELGNADCVHVLSEALLNSSQSARANVLVRALGEIGTTEALAVLRRARYAGGDHVSDAVVRKLRDLVQRSPAYQQLFSAEQHVQAEEWQPAVDDFTVALEIDPELVDAVSGRGHCHLHLDQLEAAAADFREALRRNPYDGLAVTGLGIVLVREGNVDEGIQAVEAASDRFPRDLLFAYNSACVYGRAIESLMASKPAEAEQQRIADLQQRALAQLRLAIERGFSDYDYLKRDPDLATLRELEEFKKLTAPQDASKPQDEDRER